MTNSPETLLSHQHCWHEKLKKAALPGHCSCHYKNSQSPYPLSTYTILLIISLHWLITFCGHSRKGWEISINILLCVINEDVIIPWRVGEIAILVIILIVVFFLNFCERRMVQKNWWFICDWSKRRVTSHPNLPMTIAILALEVPSLRTPQSQPNQDTWSL